MKLILAQMKHETNTYSPVPTPLARFAVGGVPLEGAAAVAAVRGTGSAIAAFIELAEAAGADYTVAIAAGAWPSGPVHDEAFEHICGRICTAVAQGCDGVLLDLHGAMVTQSFEDGEGELLRGRVLLLEPARKHGGERPGGGERRDVRATRKPQFSAKTNWRSAVLRAADSLDGCHRIACRVSAMD